MESLTPCGPQVTGSGGVSVARPYAHSGELGCRLGPMPTIGEWHMVQAVVNYGSSTYTARISLDGGPTQTHVSANNKTPRTVRTLWPRHAGAAVDHIVAVDDGAMMTVGSDPGFLSPPSGPGAVPTTFTESFEGGAAGSGLHCKQHCVRRGGRRQRSRQRGRRGRFRFERRARPLSV